MMEDTVGHLGNDLGIDKESSSSRSSDGEESILEKEDSSHSSATLLGFFLDVTWMRQVVQ